MKKLNVLASAATAATMMFGTMAPGINGIINSPLMMNVFAGEDEETQTTAVTGSITLDNPIENETYTAYKIFDVTYSGDKYAYTIDEKSPWYDVVKNFKGLTFQKAPGAAVYTVEVDVNDFSAPAFAELLMVNTGGKQGTELKKDGTNVKATGLDLGYYFVGATGTADGHTHAICNLTNTTPDTKIHDKNEITFSKTDDASTVEVGQTVNYTLKGKVPDTTGFATYIYRMEDKMSEGLTFNGIGATVFSVMVDGKPCDTKFYTLTEVDNGFNLVFSAKDMQDFATKDIVVTYSAKVNEKAVAKISQNEAKLIYSNDPKSSTSTTIPKDDTVYSAKVTIDKKNEQGAKLSGAKFKLYRMGESGEKEFYHFDTVKKKVVWGTEDAADVVETDAEGYAEFNGLKNGDYYLRETEAPAGYNLLTEDQPIEVKKTNNETEHISFDELSPELNPGENDTPAKLQLTAKAEVVNKTGAVLPETGGMGTTVLYAAGGVLVVGAGLMLVRRNRREEA